MGGAPAANAARLVSPGEPVSVARPAARFVGRGGEKLAAALSRFDVDLTGRVVLDAGSSTGGFTDCALQAGAARVVAVDVGRGQLHRRLLTDPRVDARERTNVRELTAVDLGGTVDVVVADLSFISLRMVVEPLLGLVRPGGVLVWLVKPQFEAERREADASRGVITDPAIWRRGLLQVCVSLEQRGAAIMGLMISPLRGADGNVEFLLHAVGPGHPLPERSDATDALIDAVVAEATAR